MPLASVAVRILTVSLRPPNFPSVDSSLAIVGSEMPEAVLGRSRRPSTYVRHHDLACLLMCSCPDLDLDLTPQRRQKAHQPFNRRSRGKRPRKAPSGARVQRGSHNCNLCPLRTVRKTPKHRTPHLK